MFGAGDRATSKPVTLWVIMALSRWLHAALRNPWGKSPRRETVLAIGRSGWYLGSPFWASDTKHCLILMTRHLRARVFRESKSTSYHTLKTYYCWVWFLFSYPKTFLCMTYLSAFIVVPLNRWSHVVSHNLLLLICHILFFVVLGIKLRSCAWGKCFVTELHLQLSINLF